MTVRLSYRPQVSLPLMIASFGASAVLLFGVPASKLAQPRNFLGVCVCGGGVWLCGGGGD